MIKPIFIFSCFICIAVVMAAMPFKQNNNVETVVHIQIHHYVGDKPLILDSATYTNDVKQAFTVSMLKYYIGRFSLIDNKNRTSLFNEYFLVDEADSATKSLFIENVPLSNYDSISFIIGVDSINNCSGAQSGALDPVKGMFWSWNTGYIFFKMEGNAIASNNPDHTLEYHVGGYKKPNMCIRRITLPMHINTRLPHAEVNIKSDLMRLFNGKHIIDFVKLPSVTDFHNATTMADNYGTMFSIINK